MHIWINTAEGKSINLEVEDSSDKIDIKIHGEPTSKVVLVMGPYSDAVMRIFVTTLAGKTFILEVIGSHTIEKVKNMIHEQGGPPVNKQKLIFQGKQLNDTRTVADCKIKTDSNLIIMSELCGC